MLEAKSSHSGFHSALLCAPDFLHSQVFAKLPARYAVVDRRRVVVGATDAFLSATAASRDHVLGAELAEVYRADELSQEALQTSLARVLCDGRSEVVPIRRFVLARVDQHGEPERWWRAVNTAVTEPDGQVRWVIHELQDAHDPAEEVEEDDVALRAVHVELDRQRSALERFFALSHDLMCMLDREGVLLRVNPAISALGYAPEDLIGTKLFELTHPFDLLAHREAIRLFLRGVTIPQLALRFQAQDGSYRWISWSVASDQAGVLFAVGRDVTDLRRRHQELLSAKEAAELANRELEAFSYSVAHDLRAPLRAIDGFSKALQEDWAPQLVAEAQSLILDTRHATGRMGRLIDDLLQLATLSRTELGACAVDIAALALGVVARLRAAAPERDVRVEIADSLPAYGDPRLLVIALENLIGNAWKFTARAAAPEISVGVQRRLAETVFFVRDNGAGFDMTYAGKLFAPFQRLHDRGEFEGTGIGLATVQRIVHRHRGRVWAEAAPGHGATFFFTLGHKRSSSIPGARP